MKTVTPQDLFTRWVEAPIIALRKLDDGDGGFAALAISLGLYERFIDSALHRDGISATPSAFKTRAAEDLKIDEDIVDRFWNGYRLGLMHAFQPKNYIEDKGRGDAWGWDIAEGNGYEAYPTLEKVRDGVFVLKLDPWKFTEHVLNRWRTSPELINQLQEFALGHIETIKPKSPQSTSSVGSLEIIPGETYRTHSIQPLSTGQCHPQKS